MRERGFLGRAMRAPAALAQSMEEPPPKAMMAPQPSSRYIRRAASTLATVGLATVPSKMLTPMPAPARAFSSGSVR